MTPPTGHSVRRVQTEPSPPQKITSNPAKCAAGVVQVRQTILFLSFQFTQTRCASETSVSSKVKGHSIITPGFSSSFSRLLILITASFVSFFYYFNLKARAEELLALPPPHPPSLTQFASNKGHQPIFQNVSRITS